MRLVFSWEIGKDRYELVETNNKYSLFRRHGFQWKPLFENKDYEFLTNKNAEQKEHDEFWKRYSFEYHIEKEYAKE